MSRRTGPTQAVRDMVFGRDGSHCTICGSPEQLQVHHRRPRGAGGTSRPDANSPANLLLLCLDHHAWVESQREIARDRGYLLRQNQLPRDVPLIHHGEWKYLTDDGQAVVCRAPWDDACTDQTPCADCPRGAA